MDPDWSPLRAPPGSPLPWTHAINGPLATEWLDALVELVSDRALARHDGETWIFQRKATLDAWTAAGWLYRSLNLSPAADTAWRSLRLAYRHGYRPDDQLANQQRAVAHDDPADDGTMVAAATEWLARARLRAPTTPTPVYVRPIERVTIDCDAALLLECLEPPFVADPQGSSACGADDTLDWEGRPTCGHGLEIGPAQSYSWKCWSYQFIGSGSYNVLPALRESFLSLRALAQSWRLRGFARGIDDAHIFAATRNAELLSLYGFSDSANNPNLTGDLHAIVDRLAAADHANDERRKREALAEIATAGGLVAAAAGAVNPVAGAIVGLAVAAGELLTSLLSFDLGLHHISNLCGVRAPAPVPLYLDPVAGATARAPGYAMLGPDVLSLVTVQEALASRTDWAKRARPGDAVGATARADVNATGTPNAPSSPMSTGAKVALGGLALAGVGGAASLAMGVDPLMWIGQLVGGRKRRK